MDFKTEIDAKYKAYLYQQMKLAERNYTADPTNALKVSRYLAAKLRYQDAQATQDQPSDTKETP